MVASGYRRTSVCEATDHRYQVSDDDPRWIQQPDLEPVVREVDARDRARDLRRGALSNPDNQLARRAGTASCHRCSLCAAAPTPTAPPTGVPLRGGPLRGAGRCRAAVERAMRACGYGARLRAARGSLSSLPSSPELV
eukprot:COSAG01_NODE_4227_length_5224_cov_4.060683_4_plen_138_part_00